MAGRGPAVRAGDALAFCPDTEVVTRLGGSGAGPAGIDTSVPNVARIYDYILGGKDNFAADRAMGERTLQAYPNLVYSVRANRAFLARKPAP